MSVVCVLAQDLIAVCLQIVCYHLHLECHVPKKAIHVVGSCVDTLYNDDGYPLASLNPARVLHKLDKIFAKCEKPLLLLFGR